MVCAPVRSIIHSLKLVDVLSIQAHKPCSILHIFSVFQSRAASDIHSRYSAKYRSTPDLRTHLCANSPFLPKVNVSPLLH